MICLALGLGALGFAAMRHARHCPYAASHSWYGSPWQRGSWRHRGRRALYMLFERLDASPAQERAIVAEIDKLKSRLRDTRHGLADARGDLAAALRGAEFDDGALGAVLGRIDAATAQTRGAILDALRAIHAVLDANQRESLADLVERGPWAWRRHRGPYRD